MGTYDRLEVVVYELCVTVYVACSVYSVNCNDKYVQGTCIGKCSFTSACRSSGSASIFAIDPMVLIASSANRTSTTALEKASKRLLDNSCSALAICRQQVSVTITHAIG